MSDEVGGAMVATRDAVRVMGGRMSIRGYAINPRSRERVVTFNRIKTSGGQDGSCSDHRVMESHQPAKVQGKSEDTELVIMETWRLTALCSTCIGWRLVLGVLRIFGSGVGV